MSEIPNEILESTESVVAALEALHERPLLMKPAFHELLIVCAVHDLASEFNTLVYKGVCLNNVYASFAKHQDHDSVDTLKREVQVCLSDLREALLPIVAKSSQQDKLRDAFLDNSPAVVDHLVSLADDLNRMRDLQKQ